MIKIIKLDVKDVRFPTSKDLTGSDAIHTDPDYSATYVTVFTSDNNLKGFGIAFTIGKGNDIVAECIKHFFPLFIGKTIDELEKAFGRAKGADRTYLIAVRIQQHQWTPGDAWWDVGVPEVSERSEVRQARADHSEDQQKQRVGV